jgi:hypothetical protein
LSLVGIVVRGNEKGLAVLVEEFATRNTKQVLLGAAYTRAVMPAKASSFVFFVAKIFAAKDFPNFGKHRDV